MKNLHLMPMGSVFEDNIILQLNSFMSYDQNLFVLKHERNAVCTQENCIIAPERFNVTYINQHYREFNRIVLHSLYLTQSEILQLSNEAAQKIIWCVWGHDLYSNAPRKKITPNILVRESIHAMKKLLRGTYWRMHRVNQQVKRKVSLFHCIAIGYFYDEKMIRKKYGNTVPVKIAPYFSDFSIEDLYELRNQHLNKPVGPVNVLIGHSGFDFLEHEKYLRLLSRYASENIHINMVLSYGASPEKINELTNMAYSIFGKEKCTILTEMMPMREYYAFLANMDIAIFGYKHQSALDNTKILAFSGAKMYFMPDGVLAKGFLLGGVETYNCRDIGRVSFEEFCKYNQNSLVSARLFDTFRYKNNLEAWKTLMR